MSAGFAGIYLLFVGSCMTFVAVGLAALSLGIRSCGYCRHRWQANRP